MPASHVSAHITLCVFFSLAFHSNKIEAQIGLPILQFYFDELGVIFTDYEFFSLNLISISVDKKTGGGGLEVSQMQIPLRYEPQRKKQNA